MFFSQVQAELEHAELAKQTEIALRGVLETEMEKLREENRLLQSQSHPSDVPPDGASEGRSDREARRPILSSTAAAAADSDGDVDIDATSEEDAARLKEALGRSTRRNHELQSAVLQKDQELALQSQWIQSLRGGSEALLGQSGVWGRKDVETERMWTDDDDDDRTLPSDDETLLGGLPMRGAADKAVKRAAPLEYPRRRCSIAPRPSIQGDGMSGVYAMVEDMRRQIHVRTHKAASGAHKCAVTAPQVLVWLRSKRPELPAYLPGLCCSEDADVDQRDQEADALAEMLLDTSFLKQLHGSAFAPFKDDGSLFRFTQDEVEAAGVLNCKHNFTNSPRRAIEVSIDLLRMAASLPLAELSTLSETAGFREFEKASAELQRVNFDGMSQEAIWAFFINVHNMLVLHAYIVRKAPINPKSKAHRTAFLRSNKYKIGEHRYSIDDIRETILRAKLSRGRAGDARIHFAASMASSSCPTMRVYTAESLDQELNYQAEAYLQQVRVRAQSKEITIPKVFKWYKEDFGDSKSEVLNFIFDHASPAIQREVQELMRSTSTRIKYAKYDWAIDLKHKVCCA